MISIVLPVYNGEKYLCQSIKSIISQTYRDFELIIVDDASTDSTSKIIEEFKKKDLRIKSIRNKTNLKIADSLNEGFKIAKGDYYTWTSDDNIFKECALERMYKTFCTDKTIDFVYADYMVMNECGEEVGPGYVVESDNLFLGNCIGACFLYKAKVHQTLNGYNGKYFLCEDYDFWMRAYEHEFKFYHLNETLYNYRVHSESLTSSKNLEVEKATVNLLMDKLDSCCNEEIIGKIKRQIKVRKQKIDSM